MTDEVKIELFNKQKEVLRYLFDNETQLVVFAGRANDGKSWAGSVWLMMMGMAYPGTRWAMARSTLKLLKTTTLKTWKDACKEYSFTDWKFNNASNTIYFKNGIDSKGNKTYENGSEIVLVNLEFQPSDPDGDFLGGLELTGAIIEEIPQIEYKYFEVLVSRIRYKLDENNLNKKCYITGNPTNEWPKQFFYNRFIKGTLPKEIKFIDTNGSDNKYRGKNYESGLSLLSEQSLRRLEHGDWEYASSTDQLFLPDKIENIFTGLDYGTRNDYYITCDAARMGEDSTVICLWNGLKIINIVKLTKTEITDTYDVIFNIQNEYKVPRNKVIVDSTGLGAGLRDMLKCKEFHSNNKPFKNEKFDMIKSQMFFKLSKTDWSIATHIKSEYKEQIRKELESIRDKSDDNKYKINNKDDQKRLLQNSSPDFADSIMLRMYFLYTSDKVNIDVV